MIFFINSFFYAIFVINFVRRGVDDLLVKTKIVHHLEKCVLATSLKFEGIVYATRVRYVATVPSLYRPSMDDVTVGLALSELSCTGITNNVVYSYL